MKKILVIVPLLITQIYFLQASSEQSVPNLKEYESLCRRAEQMYLQSGASPKIAARMAGVKFVPKRNGRRSL